MANPPPAPRPAPSVLEDEAGAVFVRLPLPPEAVAEFRAALDEASTVVRAALSLWARAQQANARRRG